MSRPKSPPQTEKRCSWCALVKPAAAFYRKSTGRLRSNCKKCQVLDQAARETQKTGGQHP